MTSCLLFQKSSSLSIEGHVLVTVRYHACSSARSLSGEIVGSRGPVDQRVYSGSRRAVPSPRVPAATLSGLANVVSICGLMNYLGKPAMSLAISQSRTMYMKMMPTLPTQIVIRHGSFSRTSLELFFI